MGNCYYTTYEMEQLRTMKEIADRENQQLEIEIEALSNELYKKVDDNNALSLFQDRQVFKGNRGFFGQLFGI